MLVGVGSIDVLDRMMIRRKRMHSVWSFVVQRFVRFCCTDVGMRLME
jgi:hypothetical protein